MVNVPVFLITGFLESGKTSFIKEIFNDPEFAKNDKVILFACENGIEEYEEEFLIKNNIKLVNLSSKEEFNTEFLTKANNDFNGTKIIIEYNGMWPLEIIENIELPKSWEIAQIISLIDGHTFESYFNNMKSLLIDQFRNSDLVIFNRCNDKINKLKFRNAIKSLNSRTNIMFELENGEIDDRPLELPFNKDSDLIEFEDYDFGVWFFDITENPQEYYGKNVKARGMVYRHPNYPKNIFAFGRKAMTCCEDDISYLLLYCMSENDFDVKNEQWIEVEGTIGKKYLKNEGTEIPVILVKKCNTINKPEEELVYF